jgi:hypothetical protein
VVVKRTVIRLTAIIFSNRSPRDQASSPPTPSPRMERGLPLPLFPILGEGVRGWGHSERQSLSHSSSHPGERSQSSKTTLQSQLYTRTNRHTSCRFHGLRCKFLLVFRGPVRINGQPYCSAQSRCFLPGLFSSHSHAPGLRLAKSAACPATLAASTPMRTSPTWVAPDTRRVSRSRGNQRLT